MSTTEGRRERMQRILKLMFESKRPLTPNEIAAKTEIITEITMDRFYKYLHELEWCGIINKHGNTYSINFGVSINRQRERERKRERPRERKKK